MSRLITDPRLPDAQAGHEGHGAVDDDRFPVIAAQPAQRTIEPRRVVAAHLDRTGTKPVPECARGLAESAHPVVEHPHLHALGCFPEERLREQRPLGVLVHDVHLEMNRPLRTIDGLQPGRIVFGGVLEQDDADCHRTTVHQKVREKS